MVNCCVFGCTNNSSKVNTVSYHVFPAREKSPERYNAWISSINRVNFAPTKNTRVCSTHFTDRDYQISPLFRRQLMPNSRSLRHLKKSAIPSLFLTERPRTVFTPAKQRNFQEVPSTIPEDTSEKSPPIIDSECGFSSPGYGLALALPENMYDVVIKAEFDKGNVATDEECGFGDQEVLRNSIEKSTLKLLKCESDRSDLEYNTKSSLKMPNCITEPASHHSWTSCATEVENLSDEYNHLDIVITPPDDNRLEMDKDSGD